MSIRISDLTIHEGLSVVTVDGFEPEKEYATDENGVRYEVTSSLDLPGSANWLCDAYDMSEDDRSGPGILWTDYDAPDWRFSVLLDEGEVGAFRDVAMEAGYTIASVKPITEPTNFGDGMSGTVEILKHRDGWVVLDR